MFYILTLDRYLPCFGSAILDKDKNYAAALNSIQLYRERFIASPLPKAMLNFAIKEGHPFWDVLYTGLSYNQFYASNKLKKILEQFQLPPHCFYSSVINKDKNEKKDYHFLHLLYTVENPYEIDYTKSTFCIVPLHPPTPCTLYGYFSFPSYEEAAKQYNLRLYGHPITHNIISPNEEDVMMYPYWIKDMSKFYEEEKSLCACYLFPSIKQYDLFVLPFLQDFVVSERLYKALIENNITGIKFKDASFLKIS